MVSWNRKLFLRRLFLPVGISLFSSRFSLGGVSIRSRRWWRWVSGVVGEGFAPVVVLELEEVRESVFVLVPVLE